MMSQSALGLGGERRYSVPSNPLVHDPRGMHSEDLHAWSIYRQNLNSDFTDSALGSTDKSPLPYGNFQLRDTTVQSILSHPRYGPKSALGSNMYTYLKFGLPRVFPPNHNGSQRSGTPKPKTSIGSGMKPVPRIQRQSRGIRETSSGYDSSDNETSTNYKYSRKYRSDPDFRMQHLHTSYQPQGGPGVPLVAMQQAGLRNEPHWTNSRHKSVSEANLLGIEARPHRPSYSHRRNSVADFVPDNDHQSYLMAASHLGGRMSKAGSHMSLAQSRKQSTLRPGDHLDGYTHSAYIYPNYYVNSLEITAPDNKSALLVSGLSFEVKSGEILAVLATSQHEATGLLDVLAGVRKKLTGDIVLNGQPVASSTLRKVAAYVRKDTSLCPSMTVEHTLRFHAALRRPRSNQHQVKMDDRDRINWLIEELGLDQVRDTNVARLTRSEIRRLNVACQLLLDTAILILDQPTKEMDIFDTFFLVEYLRNWASGGRVVIMSLHPPTYEIFAMLTKVVLISAGRTMFSGYRRDMLPYFASIDYPCPAFKNPSDYYLDLVTLDDLSAAAMLESSGRIEALAGLFAGAQAPPEPPPPVPLPAPVARPNVAVQAFALIEKSLVFTQMTTLSNVVTRVLIAAIMSLITGTIFWDLPTTDAKLTQNDRVGYHYSVMCLSLCPLLMWLTAREASSMRRHVERDVAVPLYSRTVFILYDQFLELWSAVLTWFAYLVPSYAMSGLYAQTPGSFDGFYIYLGYTALYLIATQMMFRAFVFLVPMEKTATILAGFCFLLSTFANGVMLHQQDLPQYWRWLEYVSPSRWTLPEILMKELSETALRTSISKEMRCTNKQRPYNDIIVQSQCPPPNGTQVLSNYEYLRADHIWEWSQESFLIALAIFYAVFAVIALLAFVCDCTKYVRRKERNSLKGHKVTVNTP
ncbi:ATP-binding cassette sub-family G member 8 [Cydia fagiglandana]|uniref:ATP-binding cassette sub-family G member 8 n=1 Tax=Cydia fagiglandana TaxID=1458189 RepID=UPI002FEE3270